MLKIVEYGISFLYIWYIITNKQSINFYDSGD